MYSFDKYKSFLGQIINIIFSNIMRLQINAWSLTNKVDIMNVNLFGAIKLEMLNLALYVLTLIYSVKALLILSLVFLIN